MKTKFWRLADIQLSGGKTYEGKDNSLLVVTETKFILIRDEKTNACWNKEFMLNVDKPVTLIRKRVKR